MQGPATKGLLRTLQRIPCARRSLVSLVPKSSRTSQKVLKAHREAAQGIQNQWKGKEKIQGAVNTLAGLPARSPEMADIASGQTDEEEYSTSDAVEPGTFVEVRRAQTMFHGITLGESYSDATWWIITLSSKGTIILHRKADITFAIPDVAPHNLTTACGLSDTTEVPSEIGARVEVFKRMKSFERSAEVAQSALSRGLAELYEKVQLPSPTMFGDISVYRALKVIAPTVPMTAIALLVVHKTMMADSLHFLADPVDHRKSLKFKIVPKARVDAVTAVDRMLKARGTSNVFESFAAKARPIILANRELHKSTMDSAPTSQKLHEPVFKGDDATIVSFLVYALRNVRQNQTDVYAPGVFAILKAINMHTGSITNEHIHSLLVDLGVIAPWEDIISLQSELYMDHLSPENSRKAFTVNRRVEKYIEARKTQDLAAVLSEHDFIAGDPMSAIRRDFGDTPVYVIDDAGAEELDDGVSIEWDPETPNSPWFHVHIADPTALIHPTHKVAIAAGNMMETKYLIHRTWPMIPPALMRQGLSLGSNGEPSNVLTFSFKIGDIGEITDHKIQAGLVRNVRILQYDAVNVALGLSLHSHTYPFGNPNTEPIAPATLTEAEKKDLRALNDFQIHMVKTRRGLPIFEVVQPKAELSMAQKPMYATEIDMTTPTEFSGFVDLTYRVTMQTQAPDARNIVAELMKCASRVASRWCLEKDIPILRRTALPIMCPTEGDFEALLGMRDENNQVPFIELSKRDTVMPKAGYSLEPLGHWSLGVPEGEGYTRVTSPLRRYNDLIAHWQIKHALLHPGQPPLFSRQYLAKFSQRLVEQDSERNRLYVAHTRYWTIVYIQRWHRMPPQLRPAKDPFQNLTAMVVGNTKANPQTRTLETTVQLPTLGLRAVLVHPQGTTMEVGSTVKIQILQTTLGMTPTLRVESRD